MITRIFTLMVCLCFLQVRQCFAFTGFMENTGQVTDQYLNPRNDIRFSLDTKDGIKVYFSTGGIHYQWHQNGQIYRMDVLLSDRNENINIIGQQKQPYYEQYAGKSKAACYAQIAYKEVYPGIDWIFYLNSDGKLEHDFIIGKDADPSKIKVQYLGADQLQLDRSGNLLVTTPFGSIKEQKPYAYQQDGKTISSNYLLQDGILSFGLGKYKGAIVIDPVIDWATYIGSTEFEEVWDTKVAKDGMVYITGATNSSNNIATVGAHLTTFAGGSNPSGADAFLMKFNQQGQRLWGTYIGGSNVEHGLSLAIDTAGYLYVAGRTNSQNGISTVGAYQEVKAGTNASYDAFLVKFDTAGQQIWGTYFGGTGVEGTDHVAVTADRYNNIYLVGNTQSPAGIATPGSFQATRPGTNDGFIAKFSSSGNRIWSTYLGTTANDAIIGVTTDTLANVIVTGYTVSTTGIATNGVYQQTGSGGQDAFVAKFDSAGNRVWATYYGGTGYERPYRIITDSLNDIYFTGATESQTGISTANAYQVWYGGGTTDAFLAKLSSFGSMLWSTYFGGSGTEIFSAIDFSGGSLYMSGETTSPSSIATPDGIKPVYDNSPEEVFLAKFGPGGNRTWATYLGGDVTETGKSISVQNGNVFIGGGTNSVNNFATTGAFQTVFGGLTDAMLMKIKMCDLPPAPGAIVGKLTSCEGNAENYQVPAVSGVIGYTWILPTGWTGSSTSNSITVTLGGTSGMIKVVAINSCGNSDTATLQITVNPAPHPTITQTGNILTVNQTYNSYQWLRNGQDLAGANGTSYAVNLNGTYSLRVNGSNGCSGLSNEIEITNSNGIKDVLAQNGILVSPNPFNRSIRLEMPQNGQLRIMDITGNMVLMVALKAGNNTIATEQIAAGTYLLQVFDRNGKSLGSMQMIKTNS